MRTLQPKVSVVLPTYNRAHLVGDAILSVFKQTFTNFELIVVDDGSTDHTEEVVRSFADPRLCYLKRSNGGAAAARNTGLAACRGEYIAFLDSDDLFLPNTLRWQMVEIEKDSTVGLVYGLSTRDTGVLLETREQQDLQAPQLGLKELLLGPSFAWPTVLLKRSLLQQVGGFDEELTVGEEWDLTLRLALANCRMVCIPRYLVILRIQPVRLSLNIHQHEAGSKAILDRAFAHPNMPPDLLPLKRTAYATLLVSQAAMAYLGGHPQVGKEMLARAVATDPSLLDRNIALLADKLFDNLVGLCLDSPEEMLQQVIANLSPDRSISNKIERQLWSKYYAIVAFQAHWQGRRLKCSIAALRAITETPISHRNRGLVSLLCRSLLGNQFFNALKQLQSRYLPTIETT